MSLFEKNATLVRNLQIGWRLSKQHKLKACLKLHINQKYSTQT